MPHTHASKILEWYKTPQGEVALELIQSRFSKLWPDKHSTETLLIAPRTSEEIFFPNQKVTHLTGTRASEGLPFADKSLDYICIAHTLEFLGDIDALLNECQRVLVPSGKILLMTPNRMSAWARAVKTPFGVGQPYTVRQLQLALEDASLRPTQSDMTLFFPPINMKSVLNAAHLFENWGRVLKPWCAMGGGVLLVEGRKDAVGGTAIPTRKKLKPALGKPALGAAKVKN